MPPGDPKATPAHDETRETRDLLRRRLAKLIFGLAAVGAIGLALVVFFANGEPKPDRALAAAALAILGIIPVALYLVPPADLQAALGRVKSVTVGSLGIELGDYAGLAGPAESVEDDNQQTGNTLLDLRVGLEMKLSYLAKHVFGAQPDPDSQPLIPAFLTVGSLHHDGYLSKEHTRIAYDILTMRSYELRSLTESERGLFLAGAENFVKGFRTEVFSAHVRMELQRAGWRAIQAFPQRRLRRDLLVQSTRQDGTQHHVIPVFALGADSSLFETPRQRLENKPLNMGGGSRFLVVPPLSTASDQDGDVRIVKLRELLAALGAG